MGLISIFTSCNKTIDALDSNLPTKLQLLTISNPNISITKLSVNNIAGYTSNSTNITPSPISFEEYKKFYLLLQDFKLNCKLIIDTARVLKDTSSIRSFSDTPPNYTYYNTFSRSSPGGTMSVYLYYNLNSNRQVYNPNMLFTGIGVETWQQLYTSNFSFNSVTGITNFSITGSVSNNVGGFVVSEIDTYDFSFNALSMTARIIGIR
jgi:hypothetical protein